MVVLTYAIVQLLTKKLLRYEKESFANVYLKDGRKITLCHSVEPWEFMYNYDTCKSTEMNRNCFISLLESLKQDERTDRIETWDGLGLGEYINVHTGKVEKLFGC